MVDEALQAEAEALFDSLEGVEERLETLKAERERLLEANRMLAELVERLEEELSAYVDVGEKEDITVQGYEYSFSQGWREAEAAHKTRMQLDDDADAEDVSEQIREAKASIKRLQSQ